MKLLRLPPPPTSIPTYLGLIDTSVEVLPRLHHLGHGERSLIDVPVCIVLNPVQEVDDGSGSLSSHLLKVIGNKISQLPGVKVVSGSGRTSENVE